MHNKKNILIATGGTGGHIYPAIVTAEELRRRGWTVKFIGRFGSAVDKLSARNFAYRNITAQGFVSRGPWQVFLALICLIKSCFVCLGEVWRSDVAVVLGFGGYSSFPAVFIGWALGRKTMIHEQNVCPGLANRILGRFVRKVAVSFNDSQSSFARSKVVCTGYPMRPLGAGRPRAQVLKAFGLEAGRKTVLIFGGSQGSQAINQAVLSCLEALGKDAPLQVIHLAGQGRAEGLRPRYEALPFPFYLRDYSEGMSDAYAAADLVICRSGAGTVTELGLLGLPAILIPYPFANSHQEANARVLVRHNAAVIIREKDLNPALLGDKIFSVLQAPRSREVVLQALSKDIAFDAVVRLADEVERL
ncbi:MAG: undecaprenyldiphospho-muramoylpentapeptide beta-N-acetylglucosaminyltransferase [Candidatus Omnitrophica bacterium]|nr:undecaprenyldiphospho-muramoylpentapeptide beta-N-acetylglucosaminyltransferase [Candidatus Omnitrophota bacterium]